MLINHEVVLQINFFLDKLRGFNALESQNKWRSARCLFGMTSLKLGAGHVSLKSDRKQRRGDSADRSAIGLVCQLKPMIKAFEEHADVVATSTLCEKLPFWNTRRWFSMTIEDESEIRSLLIRERWARDTCQWKKLRDAYHPDASKTCVNITW